MISHAAFVLLASVLLAVTHNADIRYFTNVRDVHVSAPDKQNYLVVDSDIWGHARPNLADLRLYDGTTQLPYILREEKPRVETVEQDAKILNLGSVGDHTEFDLDVGGIAQYDRIRLRLDAQDFVATALLLGANRLGQKSPTQLAPSTLYDFSREKLGSNLVLQLPASSFRYLHVKFTPGIRPEQIKGATVFDIQEKRANWTQTGTCRQAEQQAKNTVIACSLPAGTPLERVQFDIPPEQVNFRRNISVSAGEIQIANGDITRVRLNRAGTQVIAEQMWVDVPGEIDKRDIRITVANGDDPPLRILSVQPLALERRVYFDPAGKISLKLYYGDPKLEAPLYDYAKFFQEDSAAVPAQLGSALHNPEYAAPPDDRPWSERHKGVLWAAMLLAVAVLAVLALRGFAAKPPALT